MEREEGVGDAGEEREGESDEGGWGGSRVQVERELDLEISGS